MRVSDGKLRRRAVLRQGLGLGIGVLGLDALAACAPRSAPAATSSAVLAPPETSSIRLAAAACDAPYWNAVDFLRAEGFSSVSLVASPTLISILARGDVDIGVAFADAFVGRVGAGQPLVALGGVHPGCAELWAKPGIRTISDLRGKTIAVPSRTATFKDSIAPDGVYSFFVSLLAYVGIAPAEVNFLAVGGGTALIDAFVEGTSDAYLARAEEGALLHRNPRNPGRLILDTTMDKPWSQILCCLVLANRDWARANPVAAKRATRAILRAADVVKRDRRGAARAAIEQGLYKTSPEITEEVIYDTIKDLPYDWREYDPEDSVRFYALRLSDGNLIKQTPQQIIDEATDFAYFRQLRKELIA